MEQFTREEVALIVSALKEIAERYQFESAEPSSSFLFPFLYVRSKRLLGVADRLQAVIDHNDHKIRIL